MAQAIAPFSMTQAVRLAGIPKQFIESLIDDDVLAPDAKMRFTFQDLVLLQTARQLMDAGVARHKIVGALSHVRETFVPPAYIETLRFRGAEGARVS